MTKIQLMLQNGKEETNELANSRKALNSEYNN
jgi:hypothetical protein